MSETSQQIVSLIVSKEFNKAKNLITESMNEKLGLLLEEKLMEYAPTLFEAKKTVNSIEADGGEGSVLYSPKLAKEIIEKRKAAKAAKASKDAKAAVSEKENKKK
jgi:hypothetical protein